MWEALWDDFEDRARRLIDRINPPRDAVDHTIQWQLDGIHPFVPGPIAPDNLQLPELYSGRPWALGGPWIAFVTINPSISPSEIFPTRHHFVNHKRNNNLNALIEYFDTRFEPAPVGFPLHHGRHNKLPTIWVNPNAPLSSYQPTWGSIDCALTRCIPSQYPNYYTAIQAPLGRVAAIVDVVPWKFANWSALQPDTKDSLICAGSERLVNTLQEHTPRVIICAGKDARRAMYCRYGLPQNAPTGAFGVPPYQPNAIQRGRIFVNEQEVLWFGVPAPTPRDHTFIVAMGKIQDEIASALAEALV
jgi:hypothetical protein